MVTYVFRNGKLVDKSRAKPLHSSNAASYVISDIMDSTQHMASRRWHTSKSEFRKDTRAAGCIEIGNETSTVLKPRQPIKIDPAKRRDDIRRTIYDLRNGRS